MIRQLDDMPAGTLGFEAVGEVTAKDYEDVLAPAVRAAQGAGGIRLLYVLDDRFEGYSGGAFVQDSRLWLGHLGSWEKVACVTSAEWIVKGIDAFAWLMPGEVRSFPTADLEAAKAWVAG